MNHRQIYTATATAATSSSQSRRVRSPQATTKAQDYVRLMTRISGRTEKEIIEGAVATYGSVEKAADAHKTEMGQLEDLFAMEEAAYEAAFPAGQPRMEIGSKPVPGDDVSFARLAHGRGIRVWGGNLAQPQLFSFDFIDKDGQYIRTPADIKIYSVASGFTPCLEVHSIEKSLELADPRNSPTSLRNYRRDPSKVDPNWETYVVPEGTILRIVQTGQEDHFLHIPTRLPQGRTLTLQPYTFNL